LRNVVFPVEAYSVSTTHLLDDKLPAYFGSCATVVGTNTHIARHINQQESP